MLIAAGQHLAAVTCRATHGDTEVLHEDGRDGPSVREPSLVSSRQVECEKSTLLEEGGGMVMPLRCLDVCLVLLWVWVQPASLATAETSWQHEMLQGADASRSACFLQCHH